MISFIWRADEGWRWGLLKWLADLELERIEKNLTESHVFPTCDAPAFVLPCSFLYLLCFAHLSWCLAYLSLFHTASDEMRACWTSKLKKLAAERGRKVPKALEKGTQPHDFSRSACLEQGLPWKRARKCSVAEGVCTVNVCVCVGGPGSLIKIPLPCSLALEEPYEDVSIVWTEYAHKPSLRSQLPLS